MLPACPPFVCLACFAARPAPARRFLAPLLRCAAAIQNLRERETALQGKAAGLAREAGQQQALEQRLVTELGAARAQEAALPRKIEVLRSEVEARLAKAAEGERAAQDARAVRQGKLDAVRNCVALYGQRLGLRFEYEEADTLKLVFTLIDPKDHAREFSFALHVHDDNTYSLRDCSPPVEGAAQLLADLTGDNNFAGFVRTMRAKFVEMARGGQ